MLTYIADTFIAALFPIAITVNISLVTFLVVRSCKERFDKADREQGSLADLAYKENCSVYHIFCIAGRTWNIAGQKVYLDFKDYIWFGNTPYYVKDFIRKNSPSPTPIT